MIIFTLFVFGLPASVAVARLLHICHSLQVTENLTWTLAEGTKTLARMMQHINPLEERRDGGRSFFIILDREICAAEKECKTYHEK